MPLSDGIDLVKDLTRQRKFAEKGFDLMVPEAGSNCFTID